LTDSKINGDVVEAQLFAGRSWSALRAEISRKCEPGCEPNVGVNELLGGSMSCSGAEIACWQAEAVDERPSEEHVVVAGLLRRRGRALMVHRSPQRRWYLDAWDLPTAATARSALWSRCLSGSGAATCAATVRLPRPDPR